MCPQHAGLSVLPYNPFELSLKLKILLPQLSGSLSLKYPYDWVLPFGAAAV